VIQYSLYDITISCEGSVFYVAAYTFPCYCCLCIHKQLPEDDTEVSKHVGVNIIQRENIVIHICALVGFNENIT